MPEAEVFGPKMCLSCGAQFGPRTETSGYRESRTAYARRRYCSHRCADEHRRQVPALVCASCGEVIPRRVESDGSFERRHLYLARKFCSQQCFHESQLDRFKRADPPWVLDQATGCWVWQRHADKHGYGYLGRDGQRQSAHRWLYEQVVGPIASGLELHHVCERHSCVNPAHLEPLTHAEHMRRHLRRKEDLRG